MQWEKNVMYKPTSPPYCSLGHRSQMISSGFNQEQGRMPIHTFIFIIHIEEKLTPNNWTNNGGRCSHLGLIGCPACCPSNQQAQQFDYVASMNHFGFFAARSFLDPRSLLLLQLFAFFFSELCVLRTASPPPLIASIRLECDGRTCLSDIR